MSCDNVITVQDLETDKKHSTFYREVITGKAGGTGADIDSATNAVTGQTQATLPKVLSNVGFSPAGFDFTTGGTLTERDKAIFYQADGNWYSWGGTLPKIVPPASSPVSTGGIADNAWNVSTSAFMYRDWEGFTADLLAQAGIVDDGQPDELGNSKRVDAINILINKKAVFVSVKDFGAVGDGVADDTAAIQTAIDAVSAAGGGTLYFPADMTLRCTQRIIGKKGVSIKCEPTTSIDFRGADWLTPNASLALFGYYGAAGTEILVNEDMVNGDNKIAVPDTSVFSAGDLIECSMNDSGKWNDTSTTVVAGQLAVVTAVYPASGNIVLSEPIYETLEVSKGARIRKIDPIKDVIIDGLGIIGNGRNPAGNAEQGIKIFFGQNCTIKNCRLVDVDTQSIGFVSCYTGSISGNDVVQPPLGTIDAISYGIAYSSSMHIRINDNRCINQRHGIISSHMFGGYGYYGINRFIKIYNNTITSNYGGLGSTGFPRSHGGIATHTDVEFCDIYDNTIIGCRYGINIRTPNNTVRSNRIDSCKIGVYLSEYWGDIDIICNTIQSCPQPVATDSSPYEVGRGVINITDNNINGCSGSAMNFPTTGKSKLVLSRNTFRAPTNTGATATIAVYGNSDFIATANIIDVNCTIAFRAAGTGYQFISGNSIESKIPYDIVSSIYIVTSNRFVVSNNTITAPNGSLNGGISCQSKLVAPSSVVSNNVYIGV